MLTRIEIDGFKTFRNFHLDLSPFMVVLGRNASGKSNLFDAIQFVRRLAEVPVIDAVQDMRGTVEEMFHTRQDGSAGDQIHIAVEVLLEPRVSDRYSESVEVAHSRMRYEIRIERRTSEKNVSRLFVANESATLIRRDDDRWLRNLQLPGSFRATYLRYAKRKSTVLLDTVDSDVGRREFEIHQDGHAGRPRMLPAHSAEATALSSITTAEFPLLYALRSELQSWRFLQLDPLALRRPSSFQDENRPLSPTGEYLGAVLRRIQGDGGDNGNGLTDLAADLASLVPGLRGVEVREDHNLRQWAVTVKSRDEAPFSARVASDGTLRLLALLAALYDPGHRGLICFEEPENGVYPQRLVEFIRFMRILVREPFDYTNRNNPAPLGQLLVNSHSPLVLDALPPSDVVFLDTATMTVKGSAASRITRARRLRDDGEHVPLPFADDDLPIVSAREVEAYHARQQLDVI